MRAARQRGLPPQGIALLHAILTQAHDARPLRDGSVVVAFVLNAPLADRLFAFDSDDREYDGTAADDDAEASEQAAHYLED